MQWWQGVLLLLALLVVVAVTAWVLRRLGRARPSDAGAASAPAAQPAQPQASGARITICGPNTTAAYKAATASTSGSLTIGGVSLRIASGTRLTGADPAAGTDPLLCLDAALNSAGQILSGTLTSAASATPTLTISGPVTMYAAATADKLGTITIAGVTVPLATGTALAGLSPSTGADVRLQATLNASGQIVSGTISDISGPFLLQWTFGLELFYIVVLLAGIMLYNYAPPPSHPTPTSTSTPTAGTTTPTRVATATTAPTAARTARAALASAAPTATPGPKTPPGSTGSGSSDPLAKFRDFLHQLLPDPIGPIPSIIPWLGAFGAVIRGLSRSFGEIDAPGDVTYEQLPSNLTGWHITRPFIGAAFGVFGFFAFLAVLDPTGKNFTGNAHQYGVDIVAFILGYSDGTFVALLKRAVNLFIGPGDGGSSRPQT